MRKTALILLSTAILLTGAPARALTWSACVELARSGNADLKAGREAVLAAEAQEGVARAGFFPRVEASVGYSETGGSSVASTSGTTASLSGAYNLFAGLSDLGRARQAAANTRSAEAAYRAAASRVSFELKSAYQGLLYAEAYGKLTREIIRRREENQRLVELRFESGRENKGSVLLAKAYLGQARYDDLQAANARRVAQARLARSLGIAGAESSDGGAVDALLAEDAVPVAAPPESEPDLRLLAAGTPAYLQAAAREDAAEAAALTARSGLFFPSLNLTGNVGRQSSEYFASNDRWTVGLSLSFPLFNGGRDYHGTRAAAANRASAMHDRVDLSRELLAALRQAYVGYVEAARKLEVDGAFREAASLRAEIARNKYNNGLLSFEDWDVIENDLISREKVYLQSRRDRVVAEAAWEQARGLGVIE